MQGVGFRYWTYRTARLMKLTGMVANERDGSVMVFVEGPDSTVGDFVKEMEKGCPGSLVRSVEVRTVPVRNLTDFEIGY